VAGLVCGRTLLRAGHEVILLEASDEVGGRVRSDVVDGFTLDRGFQVLFTAYPAAKRQLDYKRLDLRPFEPGALITQAARRAVLPILCAIRARSSRRY
jgi:phytoene dehydrogenase-like protein